MNSMLSVRPARIEDAPAMAAVHVRSWQETYRGLMSAKILDDPRLVSRRERFWNAVLSDDTNGQRIGSLLRNTTGKSSALPFLACP